MVEEEDEYPVFQVFKVSASQSSDSNLVTLKVASGNFIRFEIDTGARCNVLPVHIYKKATGDYRLENVNPVKSSIVSYDGGSIPVLGTVKIQVQRGSFTCLLLCRLVESKRCHPILGKSACKGMGLVEIKDSDAIRQSDTSGEVFSVEDTVSSSKILTKEQVVEMFPNVFEMGLVCWKVNTTSGSTNQQSLFSMLPNEVRLLFVLKSKKPLMSCIVLESSYWSRNLHPGSPLCWLSPKRMGKFAYASTQRI